MSRHRWSTAKALDSAGLTIPSGGAVPSSRDQRPRIQPLRAVDAKALADLFGELAEDPGSVHFHPHPFTPAQARRIAERVGIQADEYFGAFLGPRLIGYGMLRGWDEGYAIPSFGVAVGPAHRGLGVGRDLLRHAVSIARRRGATTVMLKVHPSNANARHLYESEGFAFDEELLSDGQLRGLLSL